MQLVQNLMENAIRYGASGGRVDIRLKTAGRRAAARAIEVQDYGPGIAPEHLPRLTERFYRVDVGASRQMKGTGLGLAIVKHILTRHGGQLEVTSEPGQGATFHGGTAAAARPNINTGRKTSVKTVYLALSSGCHAKVIGTSGGTAT